MYFHVRYSKKFPKPILQSYSRDSENRCFFNTLQNRTDELGSIGAGCEPTIAYCSLLECYLGMLGGVGSFREHSEAMVSWAPTSIVDFQFFFRKKSKNKICAIFFRDVSILLPTVAYYSVI